MPRAKTRRDVDILEQKGLWEASTFLHRHIRRLVREQRPVEVRHLRRAHEILFGRVQQPEIAGKYRRQNLDLKRIDGSPLPMADWPDIARKMMELDVELRTSTADLRTPRTDQERAEVVQLTARLSHRLALIHPFDNGNGRISRLLLNAILQRAGLPEISIKSNKSRYLRAMRQADGGDFGLLESLILSGITASQRKVYDALQRIKSASRRRKVRRAKRRQHEHA